MWTHVVWTLNCSKILQQMSVGLAWVSCKFFDQFQVHTTWVHNSYKTWKWSNKLMYHFGKSAEYMDLSLIYLAIHFFTIGLLKTPFTLSWWNVWRKIKISASFFNFHIYIWWKNHHLNQTLNHCPKIWSQNQSSNQKFLLKSCFNFLFKLN